MMSLDQEQSDKDLKEVFTMVDDDGSVRNEGLLRLLFLLKTIILPRQARDKHRESSKKDRLSSGADFADHVHQFHESLYDYGGPELGQRCGKRLSFLRRFRSLLKTEYLPRQARDKHEKR